MAIKTDKLCLAWTGDYESLKQFVHYKSLKLDGIWSQPGGDKKVFNADDCLISWRKNNKLLFIEGKREIQGCSQLDNWGGLIFIYSGSAQLISFEINCFYGL